MTTVYITEPGTSVHKVDERLVLRKANKTVSDIPLLRVKQVAIVGRGIDVSTEALLAMVERSIDICFFTRSLKFRARVSSDVSMFGQLRFLQARLVDNPPRQLVLAKMLVRGKLINQRRLLASDHKTAAGRIGQIIERLPAVAELEVLRGYEGQGAAIYFEALRGMLRDSREWGFKRREYYPPPDPVNALLSFGNSLLTRDALAAVYLVGLDPYLGFFHLIDYGRPSLALDVVEEFRPLVVDRLVLQVINQKLIKLDDFELTPRTEENNAEASGGVRLKPAARNRFLELYEERMAEYVPYELEGRNHPLRRVVERQVRQLARIVLGEANDYKPFSL